MWCLLVMSHDRIAEQLGELRAELRTYVQRHDTQHDELCTQHDQLRKELKSESKELAQVVQVNTEWRQERQAWEKVGRYVIGTNVLVLAGFVAIIASLLTGHI